MPRGLTWLVLLTGSAWLAACNVSSPPRDGGRRVSPDLEVTEVGRKFEGGKVVATAVDRRGLSRGEAYVTVRNETDEFLPDLTYDFMLYYVNPKASERKSIPYVSLTSPSRRIYLDSHEEVTLHLEAGTLDPGAVNMLFRLRQESPVPTKVGDRFLNQHVRVVSVDRDWSANPPRARFRVRSDWDSPLRMRFRVLILKDEKAVFATPWQSAPEVLKPKGEIQLEAEVSRSTIGSGAAVYPSLQIRRPDL